MKRALTCILALVVGGCATGSAADQAINPLGIYDFTTFIQGQAVSGTIRIERMQGRYRGGIMTTGLSPMSILNVAVDGQWLTIRSNTGTNPLELILAFVGNSFTGEWIIRNEAGEIEDRGTLSGRRRTGSRGRAHVPLPIAM